MNEFLTSWTTSIKITLVAVYLLMGIVHIINFKNSYLEMERGTKAEGFWYELANKLSFIITMVLLLMFYPILLLIFNLTFRAK